MNDYEFLVLKHRNRRRDRWWWVLLGLGGVAGSALMTMALLTI